MIETHFHTVWKRVGQCPEFDRAAGTERLNQRASTAVSAADESDLQRVAACGMNRGASALTSPAPANRDGARLQEFSPRTARRN